MAYKLGTRSLERLEGVDERLVAVVKAAIGRSSQDFSVLEGLRSMDRQRELFKKGHSQTMKSKHLNGLAVDLGAYDPVTGIRWEEAAYFPIANAMKDAAKDCGVAICWGASWHIEDITKWDGTMEEAMNAYVDLRRGQGRRPFIDGPHFQLN